MEQTVAMNVPSAWLEGIAEEPLTLQGIFRVGLYHYKVARRCGCIVKASARLAIWPNSWVFPTAN